MNNPTTPEEPQEFWKFRGKSIRRGNWLNLVLEEGVDFENISSIPCAFVPDKKIGRPGIRIGGYVHDADQDSFLLSSADPRTECNLSPFRVYDDAIYSFVVR